MNGPVTQSLANCAQVFDRLGIPYVLMGGIAVRAYALPRPTFDVDFTLVVSRERLPILFAELEDLGYDVADAYRTGWVDSVAGMPVVKARIMVGDHSVDVDMFLAETAFQESIVKRRRKETLEGVEAWLVSAEDLILLKLISSRPRDLIDIADVLFVQGELDSAYMRQWAERLGVLASLESVLRDASNRDERP
jgi:predicted nucleotidyltransferase